MVRIGNNKNVGCSISGITFKLSILDKGVNGIDLACNTVANLESDLLDQDVYLTVKGFSEITCETCKYSFLSSRTPVLKNIIPRTV